jgi:hypothetical protein
MKMPALGFGYGNNPYQAKLSLGGGGTTPKPVTTTAAAAQQNMATTATPQPTAIQGADADYIRNLPTAYTPEQTLLMKSNLTNQAAAQNRGGINRISEIMAARGLSGSGAETGAISNFLLNNARNLQSGTSNIDINNANQNLQNSLAKGGLINSLIGQGADLSKYYSGLNSDMYKFGTQFDYNKYRDTQNYNDYQKQYDLYLQMLKEMQSGGGGGGNTVARGRS